MVSLKSVLLRPATILAAAAVVLGFAAAPATAGPVKAPSIAAKTAASADLHKVGGKRYRGHRSGYRHGYRHGYRYRSHGYRHGYRHRYRGHGYRYGYRSHGYRHGYHNGHGDAVLYGLIGVGVGYILNDVVNNNYGARPQSSGYYTPPRGGGVQVTGTLVSGPLPADCRMTREYQTTVLVGGKERDAYGTACLKPDGSWALGVPQLP